MANTKPAAHRKVGLTAMLTFPLGILLAGLWIYFVSADLLNPMIEAGGGDTRTLLVIGAAVSFCLWLLTGNRFSPFAIPAKLQGFASGWLPWLALGFGLANTVFALPQIPTINTIAAAISHEFGGMAVAIALFFAGILVLWGIDQLPKHMQTIKGVSLHWTAGILAVLVGLFFTPWAVIKFAILGITIPTNLFCARYYWLCFLEWGKEHPEYRNLAIFGKGGAARFGGIYTFSRYDFSKFMRGAQSMNAPIYMGKTTYYEDPKIGGRPIGVNTQSMQLTVGKPGGGKSLYTAWTELLTWPHGCFVLDPKGEHYMMTGQQRFRKFGAQSYAIDPWHKISRSIATEKIGLMTGAEGMRGYINPLDSIDLTAITARDDLMLIVQASIYREANENAVSRHFREAATKIMLGLMVHVLDQWPKEHHNLPAIYNTFLTGTPDGGELSKDAQDKLIGDMSGNEVLGGAPMEAAKYLREASPNEKSGYITTMITAFSWVKNPAIRPVIEKSNFLLSDIKQNKVSAYLVIPFEYMNEHRRFIQTLVSMGLLACREDAPDDRWTLFLLDEFYSLGKFKPIAEGLVTLRSRKIKLHMFLQNIGQLKENYDNWEAFMSSCDKQFYAINDIKTAEALHEELGEYLERWQEGKDGEARSIDRERPLLSTSEILEKLKEGSKNQIVKPADGNAMQLKLVPFHKLFSRSEYGRVFENTDDPNAPEARQSWEPDEDPPAEDPPKQPYVDAEAEREKERQWQASMEENRRDQSTADARPDIDLNADLRERARKMGEDTSWFNPKAAEEQRDADTAELVGVVANDFNYDPSRDWALFYAKFEADLTEEEQQQTLWNIERQKRENSSAGG